MRLKLTLFLSLLFVLLAGCAPSQGFDSRLGSITKPYRFNLVGWEVQALSQEVVYSLTGKNRAGIDDSQLVVDYFDIVAQINGTREALESIQSGITAGDTEALEAKLGGLQAERVVLEGKAEAVLEKQIRDTMTELGIYNPEDSRFSLKLTFPPVELRLEEPPQLLVVSPRESIELKKTILLNPDISPADTQALEGAVSALDVSALVVGLGGIASYPSFVNNNYGLEFALDTAVEEWFHQYLFFRPLGFLYGLDKLGIKQASGVVTMNETLAGMVGQEVGQKIYERDYAPFYPLPSNPPTAPPAFDFNAAMRDIRKTVDTLLSQGQVEQAEAYMNDQRLVLASQGYFIRRLNQAYFAFFGSYADIPAFENPIGQAMQTLRQSSSSLREFVNAASALTSPDELERRIGQLP